MIHLELDQNFRASTSVWLRAPLAQQKGTSQSLFWVSLLLYLMPFCLENICKVVCCVYNVVLLLLNTVPEEGEVGSTAFLRVSLPQFDRLGPLLDDIGTTAELLLFIEVRVMTKVYVLT